MSGSLIFSYVWFECRSLQATFMHIHRQQYYVTNMTWLLIWFLSCKHSRRSERRGIRRSTNKHWWQYSHQRWSRRKEVDDRTCYGKQIKERRRYRNCDRRLRYRRCCLSELVFWWAYRYIHYENTHNTLEAHLKKPRTLNLNRGRLGRIQDFREGGSSYAPPGGNVRALSNPFEYFHQAIKHKLDVRRTCTWYLLSRMWNTND